jgi:hypothetical protein
MENEDPDPGGFLTKGIRIMASELTEEARVEARVRFKTARLPLRRQLQELALTVEMCKKADRLQPIAESIEGRQIE